MRRATFPSNWRAGFINLVPETTGRKYRQCGEGHTYRSPLPSRTDLSLDLTSYTNPEDADVYVFAPDVQPHHAQLLRENPDEG